MLSMIRWSTYIQLWPSIVAKSIAARFLRSRPRPRSYSSPLSGTVGCHHPWSQLSGSTNGDPLRSWSCAFFAIFFSCVAPLLKYYGFVCSNLGSLRFYSMVLLTCLEQPFSPFKRFFFNAIPIRHISGESENLELEALEALEAPVAPNRQDHLKWLLGVSRIIWKGRSEGCFFFCILGFKKVDLNP